MLFTEYMYRLSLKTKIMIHKILNLKLYKGVILYEVPKLIYRNKIKFGKNVRINGNVFLHGAGGIEIGESTTLSYGTTILSTGYDISDWMSNNINRDHINQKTIVGKNVWICANVTILPGVKIADNSIVAAGSIVTKDLEDAGYLYAGVPARAIKKL